jgi:hypothetical protein
MTTRTKLLSLSALLALGLAAGLWWFNRPRPASGPQAAPMAQSAEASLPVLAPAAVPEPAASVAVPPVATTVSAPSPASTAIATPAPVTTATSNPPSPSTVAPAAPAAPVQNSTELAASARMYAAHAPLRTPEVADPDSAANKRILGTMVAKMLAQPATSPTSQGVQTAR